MLELATTILNCSGGYIFFLDIDEQELFLTQTIGKNQKEIGDETIKVGECLTGWVAQENKSLLTNNIETDWRFSSTCPYEGGLKNILAVPILIKNTTLGVLSVFNSQPNSEIQKQDTEFLTTVSSQIAAAVEKARLYKKVESYYFETLAAIINAAEDRSPYLKGHSNQVAKYASMIAQEMGLPLATIKEIEYSAILHDIGKLSLSSSLLDKKGPLTKEERQNIQKHPIISESNISSIKFLNRTKKMVRQHHERFDGHGYPDSLPSSQVVLEARILSVANAFEAMLADRPYRKALSLENAINELHRNSGTQFDPEVVEALIKAVKKEEARKKISI